MGIPGVNTCPAVRTWRDSQNSNVNTGLIQGPYHPNPDGWYSTLASYPSQVDKDIAGMKAIGVQAVRFDFPWPFMEPAHGTYDWRRADYIVDALLAAGMLPTPFIGFTPVWSNPNATVAPQPGEMASFAVAVALHFKGRVKSIEIWNEPDHGHYWNSGWPAYATNALIPAYDAIKSVDPSILVVFAGLSQSANVGFWDACKAALGKFDVMGVHDYSGNIGGTVSAARSWLAANGRAGVPVWVGEAGIGSAGGGQNALLDQLFSSKADVAEWYDFRDDVIYDPTGVNVMIQTAGYGLVAHDESQKTSASHFAALAGTAPPPPPPPPTAVPPTAFFSLMPSAGLVPLSVSVDAKGSLTGTAPIAAYTFDMGDSTVIGPQQGPAANHTYTVPGVYNVRLTVVDVNGLASTVAIHAVTVQAVAPPPPPPPPPPTTGLAIKVVPGGKFVDASGAVVQLRGVNVSALEFVAAQGWSPGDPWGGVKPNWAAIAAWKANAVRLPLNSQSWLGVNGCDPGGNYRATVQQAVSDAHAQGFYVILDLHWTAPTTNKALAQQAMPTGDHDLDFWISLADTFKGDPGVIFELFNEPFQYGDYYNVPDTLFAIYQGGANIIKFLTGGPSYTAPCNSPIASMTAMLAAVRMTGAQNVVLIGGYDWCSAMDHWLALAPKDGQVAASWHPYPGQPQATSWPQDKTSVPAILAAGYPVVITETGDHNTPGTVGAPFVSSLLPWADNLGISYIGWTWDVWQNPDDVLIKDAAGTPTDGWGVYFHQHLLDRAGGGVPPPPPLPVPPIAAFSYSPAAPVAGAQVSFDASASSDIDDAIQTYQWTFGDGTTGSGAQVSHAFVAAGPYTVTLVVTDASGLSSTVGHVVTVAAVTPPPPLPPPPAVETLTVNITDNLGRKANVVVTLT